MKKIKNPFNLPLVIRLNELSKSAKGKSKYAYKNAIKSISSFVLPIKNSKDAENLKGVGQHILNKIKAFFGEKENENIIKKSKFIKRKTSSKENIRIKKFEKKEIYRPDKKFKKEILFEIDPKTYQPVLLMDNRENDKEIFEAEFQNKKLNLKFVNLPLGDFIWVYQNINSGKKIMAEIIIERKKLADFEKKHF